MNRTPSMIVSILILLLWAWLPGTSLSAAESHTMKQVKSVSIRTGKLKNADKIDIAGGNVLSVTSELSGVESCVWNVTAGNRLTFQFDLPRDSSDVVAEIAFHTTGKPTGEAKFYWNNEILRDDNDAPVTVTGDLSRKNIKLAHNVMHENTLSIAVTQGEINVQELKVKYEVPLQKDSAGKVTVTLLSPAPGQKIGTGDGADSMIDFRWTADGPYQEHEGYVVIEYRDQNVFAWNPLPDSPLGISYGSPYWSSAEGSLSWTYTGKTTQLEFRIKYREGENPETEKRLQREIYTRAAMEFLELKWKYLNQTRGSINKNLWRRTDDNSYSRTEEIVEYLAEFFEKPELEKAAAAAQQLEKMDALLVEALNKLAAVVAGRDNLDAAMCENLAFTCTDYLNSRTRAMEKSREIAAKKYDTDSGDTEKILAIIFPENMAEQITKIHEKYTNAGKDENFPKNLEGTWRSGMLAIAVSSDGRFTLYNDETETCKTYLFTYNPKTGKLQTTDAHGAKRQINIQWQAPNRIQWTSSNGTKIYNRYIKSE